MCHSRSNATANNHCLSLVCKKHWSKRWFLWWWKYCIDSHSSFFCHLLCWGMFSGFIEWLPAIHLSLSHQYVSDCLIAHKCACCDKINANFLSKLFCFLVSEFWNSCTLPCYWSFFCLSSCSLAWLQFWHLNTKSVN